MMKINLVDCWLVKEYRLKYSKEQYQQGKAMPLKKLLEIKMADFNRRGYTSYAEAWAFTRFLWSYPNKEGNGKYKKVLDKLIKGFKESKEKDKVYKEAFQLDGKPLDLDTLEKELKEYILNLKL